MQLEHNSHKNIYREPFGACKTGTSVRLRLFCDTDVFPERVMCVVNDTPVEMVCTENGNLYECTVKAPETPSLLFYYFLVKTDATTVYYGNNSSSLGGMGKEYLTIPENRFQITVYNENFKTPDWMKNAVVYQIFPDRFCRGKDTPFHGIRRSWGEEPFWKTEQFGEEYLSNDFFGGNFDGIEKKLPYLADLGITAVYLNPISKAFSNHRYDTGDYEIPDETLGTVEDFENLCKASERYGIKIILDGVYSHTGADSKYFNKYGSYDSIGAYQSEKSPYYSWYSFEKFPDKYDSWWGFRTLPNVNELEESYVGYIAENSDSVISKWLDRGAMGFRLDVADELPDEFIMRLRKALKKKKNTALLIGEVWEDASNKISYGQRRKFLLGNELDSVMNYVFREAVLTYLTDCDSVLFRRKLMSLTENYPAEALYSAMNLISSHDVPRAMTVLSGAPDFRILSREEQHDCHIPHEALHLAMRKVILAICLQMTLPGAPTVYYGDERGMWGYADPFNRCCIDWNSLNEIVFSQTKLLSGFRNENPCLRTGFYKTLYSNNGVFAYLRYTENGQDVFGSWVNDGSILVIINPADEHRHIALNFDDASVKDALSGDPVSLDGELSLLLEPVSYRLLSLERK